MVAVIATITARNLRLQSHEEMEKSNGGAGLLVISSWELTSGDAVRMEAEALVLTKPSRTSHPTLWGSALITLLQRGPGKASKMNVGEMVKLREVPVGRV